MPSLYHTLRNHAASLPDGFGYVFLEDGESQESAMSYRELDLKARAIACLLQARGLQGKPVALFYHPGLDYVAAFWGCLYAGAIAVPAYPPGSRRLLPRIQAIIADCGIGLALCSAAVKQASERAFGPGGGFESLAWLETDALDLAAAGDWREPEIRDSTLAFLQYTSGSTGSPKGVMVSHGNLIANERMIAAAFAHDEHTVVAGWLPPYHDMGLIGNILQPLYLGRPCVMMAPAHAIQKPLRWLRSISRYRATTSGCPNFFYDLCVQKVDTSELAELDLSSWKVAFNGAEPVRAETMDAFAAKFAPCGFDRRAFLPCFGLAEGTLILSGADPLAEPVSKRFSIAGLEQRKAAAPASAEDEARLLASSGQAVIDSEIRIVDPDTRSESKSGAIGEIWAKGAHIAQGYWNKPEETERTFRARISDTNEGDYLRTGDLGFLDGGELYVVGRIKDLIIVRGRNYYPQDIEKASESCHPATRLSGAAAFAIEQGGEERLAIVQELEYRQKPDGGEVVDAIRAAVFEACDIQPHRVLIVKPGCLPKTSSGKIQRGAVKALFLNGELPVVHDSAAAAPREAVSDVAEAVELYGAEREMAALWAEALKLDRVGPNDDFFALGGDSLIGMQLAARIEERFGLRLSFDALFEYATVRALCEHLKTIAKSAPARAPAHAEGDGSFPLTSMQQRIWFFSQWDKRSALYNIPAAVRLAGPIDEDALGRTLVALSRRHDALRARFVTVKGRPFQRFDREAAFPMPVIDLTDRALPDAKAEADRLARAEANLPFDLVSDPLGRAKLVRLSSDERVLLLTIHHIVADGWSLTNLLAEISALYATEIGRNDSALPALALRYQDCLSYHLEYESSERKGTDLAYWKRQLADAPRSLDFPYAKARPERQTFSGERVDFLLPKDLQRQLKAASRAEGVTLFMYLLGAYKALLYRHTGQEDLVVGTPIAGRHRAGSESVVGLFINSLALRTRVVPDASFAELLRHVKATTVQGYARQETTFESLLDELQVERDPSRAPIFQTLFQLQNAPLDRVALGDAVAFPSETDNGTVKLDLVFNVVDTQDGLACSIRYNTDLFEPESVDALRRHFSVVLEAVAKDSSLRVSEIPLLDAADRKRILVDWNATAKDFARSKLLHCQFEAQAARTPDAVALVSDGLAFSYRELNEMANQLARWLRANGAIDESLIGVCMERGWEMVVSLLSILKAGAAYVPLDPEYPADRLKFMREDLRSPAILAQSKTLAALGDVGSACILSVDTDWDTVVSNFEADDLDLDVDPERLAYVIYTSGSTGKPKGAANRHVAICNRLDWMQDAYGLDATDNVLQKTPYSFDVSVWEFFWPLVTGARLTMAKPGGHRDSRYLADTIEQEGITTLHFVPSMLRLFLQEGGLERCRSIRRVMSSGEALPGDLARIYYQKLPGKLHNLYGPTEAAVDVTYHECEPDCADKIVPIGRPIANTSIYILNERLQPAPIGVPGELHIGGVQLARGYLNRPELTAEKFIPDPFSTEPGARLYKSGDLCRFRADGVIEYLERIDFQVKIRGFRIELGEIEAAMRRIEGIEDVAVTVRKSETGESFICAYFVGRSELTAAGIRESLTKFLPDYMAPAAFVRLGALPLSSNGKLDRKALPAPDAETKLESGVAYEAPADALESCLAELWQDALGAQRVGVNDSFFEIGGNSIQGAIVINRLQERLDEIIHIVAIFDHPTIRKLGDFLKKSYADAVSRVFGLSPQQPADAKELGAGRIDKADIEWMRAAIPALKPFGAKGARRNPRAVFVLSPPRSGSTLLRVMLGGHSELFAPPELELLCFNTLQERKAAFPDRDSFSLEGTVRALMEIHGYDVDAAKSTMAQCEAEGLSTRAFYGAMQSALGDRLLVDKTPSYPLDLATLQRAEEDFEEPLYIHLARHPLAMIRSFDEARLEQVFCRYEHPYSRLQLAELIWVICQQNIQAFLAGVPSHRQLRIRFEDLVKLPEETIRYVSGFLGIGFENVMLKPYDDKQSRMTDGLHQDSRMLGDVKFHRYQKVDAEVADRWKERFSEDMLGAQTRDLAAQLGYVPSEAKRSSRNAIGKADAAHIIRSRNGESPALLSFAQERLWFLAQLEPDNYAYNVPGAVEMRGALDQESLQGAFRSIARRHEALRTVFPKVAGKPSLLVFDNADWRIDFVDLSADASASLAERRDALAREESQKPFDLAKGPLIRAKLVAFPGDAYLLLVTMHHIISDGWSLGVFVRELKAAYAELLHGREPSARELPIQYCDYAMWQRSLLQGAELDARLDFWAERLKGPLPRLELPYDRARPSAQTHVGARLDTEIDPQLVGQLRKRSAQMGSTVFTTLLSAFNVLLGKYSGSHDIVIGTPIANRHRKEVEELIGCFVNTLVLRNDLSGDPSFRECVARAQLGAREAFEHQEVPFEKIVERLNPPRELNVSPIFQIMFSYQNAQREDLSLPGLELGLVEIDNGASKFDLTLALREDGDRIAGYFEYSSALFERSSVERISAAFASLLEALLADLDRTIGAIEVAGAIKPQAQYDAWDRAKGLSEAEREELLATFNATRVDYPRDQLIHELFAARAAATPDAIAVTYKDETLTYAELDALSSRLAAKLRSEYAIGPDAIVGLMANRSADMVVGMLATLKAGGAYLPIDPTYPVDRVKYMLEDSACRVLLAHEPHAESLGFAGAVVDLGDRLALAAYDAAPLARVGGPRSLAYVIYTSGSTGNPKGVMIEHRSVANFMQGMSDAVGMGAPHAIVSVTTICFDIFVLESLVPLMLGMTMHVASEGEQVDPGKLCDLIESSGATMLQATPSLMKMVFGADRAAERLRGVQKFLVGGEPFPVNLRDLMRATTDAEIYNVYGPTETTVWSTVARLDDGPINIGRPIANTTIYIVESDNTLVARGVVGELCIGGDGLARGYWRREALTAEKFVPNPFAEGELMYRTGDLARWLPSGELECLGRIDGQVKIRGHRIEVGEIEASLGRIEGVTDPVVVARDIHGTKTLVAYFKSDGAPDGAALRESLAQTLPGYMVPAYFIVLPAIPLTANGKVDRKALPDPLPLIAAAKAPSVAPSSELERKIAEVWSESLKLPTVGIHDNFFDLGGNSLLIVEIQNKLEKLFSKPIAVAEVFNRPTVAELAKYFGGEDERALGVAAITDRASKRKQFAGRDRSSRKNALRRN